MPAINIKTLEGKNLFTQYSDTSTIEELKKTIEKEHNIPASKQRIIVSGTEPLDDTQLITLDLRNLPCIHLIVKRPAVDEQPRAAAQSASFFESTTSSRAIPSYEELSETQRMDLFAKFWQEVATDSQKRDLLESTGLQASLS